MREVRYVRKEESITRNMNNGNQIIYYRGKHEIKETRKKKTSTTRFNRDT